jgi:hypothetical protein
MLTCVGRETSLGSDLVGGAVLGRVDEPGLKGVGLASDRGRV